MKILYFYCMFLKHCERQTSMHLQQPLHLQNPYTRKGFIKNDPERLEFANEDFVKDQKHLLKSIHRRELIHKHSHPPGFVVDPERAAFEEKLERLAREKAAPEACISGFEKRATAKIQLDDLTQELDGVEQRQETLLSFSGEGTWPPSMWLGPGLLCERGMVLSK